MKNKAFTLIELLVVIAIIGVLAGVLFVAINPTDKINDSKNVTIKENLNSLTSPIMLDYQNNDYLFDNTCSITAVKNILNKYEINDDKAGNTNITDGYVACTNSGDNKKFAISVKEDNNAIFCFSSENGIVKNKYSFNGVCLNI